MLRNPRVTFFTFVFPLMFLVIFSAINGDVDGARRRPAARCRFAQFYAPSIGIFGLTLACYTNVIFGLATARDERLLKRVRGTPLPMPVYLGSWLTGAMLLGIASVVLMFVGRRPRLRRRHLPARLLPAAVVTLVLGAASLAALGLAVATLVRNADQAGPVAQLTLLPLSLHLRHLVAARRRAGLDLGDRPRVPALPPRRGVRRVLRAADDRRRLGARPPGRDRGVGRGRAARRRPALPGGAERGRARPAAGSVVGLASRRGGARAVRAPTTRLRAVASLRVGQPLVGAKATRGRLGVGQRDAARRRVLRLVRDAVVAAPAAVVFLRRLEAGTRSGAQEHHEQRQAECRVPPGAARRR